MVGARIAGTADFRGCSLRSPVAGVSAGPARGYANRYALSLASAEVGGRLMLDHGFRAIGGVSLYQTRIQNSLSLNTSRIESRSIDAPALDAEEMHVGGSVTWVNEPDESGDEARNWGIAGRIVLKRAEIGGDLKLEHLRWARECAWSMDEGGRRAVDHVSGGIDARSSSIRGQLRIGEGCRVARWTEPPARRVGEDVTSGVFGPSIDLWKSHVGRGLRIERHAVFNGPLLLNDSAIDHGVIMLGECRLPVIRAAASKIPEAVDFSDARLSGLIRLSCQLGGSVSFRRAQVTGTIELQRLAFVIPELLPGRAEEDCKRGTASLLDMSSATISGGLHFGELSLQLTGSRGRSLLALLRKWRHVQPVSERPRALGKDYLLHDGVCVAVRAAPGGAVAFSGSIDAVQAALAMRQPPATGPEAQVQARDFLDQLVDDLGPRSVTSIGDAVEDPQGGWLVPDCTFGAAGDVYAATLHVGRGGRVEICRQQQIPGDAPEARGYHVGPLQFLPKGEQLEDGTPCGEDAAAAVQAALQRFAVEAELRPVIIDLRGLRCQAFDDNEGVVWDEIRQTGRWRLLLDGIDFGQFDRTDPKERSRSIALPAPPASVIVGAEAHEAGPAVPATPPDSSFAYGRRAMVAGRRRALMLQAFASPEDVAEKSLWSRAHARLFPRWHGLGRLAADPEFSPQPFETFARAYARSGEHLVADAVISAQKRLEWMRIFEGSRSSIRRRKEALLRQSAIVAAPFAAGILYLARPWPEWSLLADGMAHYFLTIGCFYVAVRSWPWVLISAGWLFDAGFRFGLKPARALQTLVLCLLLGVILANSVGGLQPVSSRGSRPVSRPAGGAEIAMTAESVATHVAIEGCNTVTGSGLDRALYAFDVFVPLDARQECAFTISEDAPMLRLLKTLYAALGWVVVSLTVLTVSGVLRRDIEK